MWFHTRCIDVAHEDTGKDKTKALTHHEGLRTETSKCSAGRPSQRRGGCWGPAIPLSRDHTSRTVFPSNPPTSPLRNQLPGKSSERSQAKPATPLHERHRKPAHVFCYYPEDGAEEVGKVGPSAMGRAERPVQARVCRCSLRLRRCLSPLIKCLCSRSQLTFLGNLAILNRYVKADN